MFRSRPPWRSDLNNARQDSDDTTIAIIKHYETICKSLFILTFLINFFQSGCLPLNWIGLMQCRIMKTKLIFITEEILVVLISVLFSSTVNLPSAKINIFWCTNSGRKRLQIASRSHFGIIIIIIFRLLI